MDPYAINTISYPHFSQPPTLTMNSPYDIRTPQLADFERLGETLASEGDNFLPSPRTNAEYWSASSQAQSSFVVASADSLQATSSSVGIMNKLAIRPRAKVISTEEWERQKPIIEDLYIDRGMTLTLVRETMATDHGFVATEMMYKKRFTSWKWRKYYSKGQKEEALRRLAEANKAEHIIINKKPLNAERLRRPIQRNGHQIRLDQRHLQRRDIISRRQLQQSPEVHRVESFLRHARRFWLSRMDADPGCFSLCEKKKHFLDCLSVARSFLLSEDRRAFAILNMAASVVRDVLTKPSFGLLHQIVFEFTNDKWALFPEIKFRMLQYFMSMAQCTLGPSHPLCKLTAHLVDERDSKELMSRFGRLCIDTVDNVLVHLNYDAAQDIKVNVFSCLQPTKLHDESETVVQDFIRKSNEQPANIAFVCIKFLQRDFLAAEELCLQYLQIVQSETKAHSVIHEDTNTPLVQSLLAYIYRELGDREKRLAYLRMAMEGEIRLYGVKNPHVLQDVSELEECLEEYGKLEELNQLRVTWKPVWDELENELKG